MTIDVPSRLHGRSAALWLRGFSMLACWILLAPLAPGQTYSVLATPTSAGHFTLDQCLTNSHALNEYRDPLDQVCKAEVYDAGTTQTMIKAVQDQVAALVDKVPDKVTAAISQEVSDELRKDPGVRAIALDSTSKTLGSVDTDRGSKAYDSRRPGTVGTNTTFSLPVTICLSVLCLG